MRLVDQAVYRLPDGTPVVAMASTPAPTTWHLRALATNEPLYVLVGTDFRRYMYDAATDAYVPTLSDMTLDDLTLVDPA